MHWPLQTARCLGIHKNMTDQMDLHAVPAQLFWNSKPDFFFNSCDNCTYKLQTQKKTNAIYLLYYHPCYAKKTTPWRQTFELPFLLHVNKIYIETTANTVLSKKVILSFMLYDHFVKLLDSVLWHERSLLNRLCQVLAEASFCYSTSVLSGEEFC